MAYVQNQQDEDNNQLNAGQSGNAGTGSSPQAPAQQGTNRFGNLQSILQKNQNAPNVASKVGQNVQQNQQEQSQDAQQTQQNIGPGMQYDQNQLNQNIEQKNWGQLGQTLNTNYAGPKQGSIDVSAQNQGRTMQQAGALGSQTGQQQLLKQMYGKSDYTRGENRLDSFLQNRNTDFQVASANARNQARQLERQTNQGNAALNQLAGTTEQGIENTKTQTRQGLSGYNENVQTKTNQMVDAERAREQQLRENEARIKNDLATGNVEKDVLDQLGFNPDTDYTYGVNLGDFVKTQGGGASAANVISRYEADRFNNINQLLGNGGPSYDLNQAGTFQQATNMFDRQGLANAIAGGRQSYQSALSPVEGGLNAAKDIVRLTQERDAAIARGDGNAVRAAQNEIAQKYSGAVNNGTTRSDWAAANLQTKAGQFDKLKQQLDSQYLKKIGVK